MNVDIYGFNERDNSFYVSNKGEHVGVMEFMPVEERKLFHKNKLIIETRGDLQLIDPIKCNVKYRNLTSSKKLRIPSFNQWIQ